MRRNRYRRRRQKQSFPYSQYLSQGVRVVALLLGLATLSFGLITGHDYLTRCQYFSATAIEVHGAHRLTQNDILKITGLKYGVNVLAVNLALVRKQLRTHPWIVDAGVQRRLPDTLELTVTEQVPLAVVDLGRKFVLNRQGDIFKKADAADLSQLPLIRGLSYSDLNLPNQPNEKLFGAVMSVLKLGDEPGSAIPNDVLKTVYVDREIGLSMVAFDQPLMIRLGYQDYPAKYEVLTRLLTHYHVPQATRKIDWIDLNDPERVVLNLKGEVAQKKEEEV